MRALVNRWSHLTHAFHCTTLVVGLQQPRRQEPIPTWHVKAQPYDMSKVVQCVVQVVVKQMFILHANIFRF